MHQRFAHLVSSIDALTARAALVGVDGALAREINDLLSTGYARALESDGELRRLERRFHELTDPGGMPEPGELDALIARRRETTAEAMRLRARLDVLGEQFRRHGEPQLRSLA
jgi:hypothetical protein